MMQARQKPMFKDYIQATFQAKMPLIQNLWTHFGTMWFPTKGHNAF